MLSVVGLINKKPNSDPGKKRYPLEESQKNVKGRRNVAMELENHFISYRGIKAISAQVKMQIFLFLINQRDRIIYCVICDNELLIKLLSLNFD